MASTTESSIQNRDGFYKETYRFFDTLGRHRAGLIIVVALALGICLAGGVMMNRRAEKSETGLNALYLAQKGYETELKGVAGVSTPKPLAPRDPNAKEDAKAKAAREAEEKAYRAEEESASKKLDAVAFAPLDVDAKFPETVKRYRAIIEQYDGTRAAHEARLALGSLYFDHGEAAKATPLFQSSVSSAPGNAEKAMAHQALGYSLENEGKLQEAVAAYEKSAGYADGSLKGDVLLAAARCQTALKDVTKARSTYDQILSQLPNTDAAKAAESLKAKL
jgi:tetratricopeptide (TPR) repeat protein